MDAVQRNIADEEASHTRANTRESQELIIPTTGNYKPPSTDAHLSLFNGMVDGGVWTQGIRNLIIDANVRHLLHPRDAV